MAAPSPAELLKRRAERAERRTLALHDAIRTVLETPAGKTVLRHIVVEQCNLFGGSLVFGPDGDRASAANEGRRQVGRDVTALLAVVAPEQTAALLKSDIEASLHELVLRAAEAVPSAADSAST